MRHLKNPFIATFKFIFVALKNQFFVTSQFISNVSDIRKGLLATLKYSVFQN